jgi:ubiquinone/menaquinone biosynthesis C-methylase UbiE
MGPIPRTEFYKEFCMYHMMEGNDAFLSAQEWERKLKQQEEDSRTYRHKIYGKVRIQEKMNILDVGCGTGAVTGDIASLTGGQVTAVDIDEKKLDIASCYLSGKENIKIMRADATDLPFPDGTFDLVLFNIVLVYIRDQQRAINEMARVTKKGGTVLATLEPDYESSIDYPEDPVYPLHVKWMKEKGIDTRAGRKLKYLFTSAGLETKVSMDTETGYVYINEDRRILEMFHDQFWIFEKIFIENGWTPDEIEDYRNKQVDLWEKGLKFHFGCGFYAIGLKN